MNKKTVRKVLSICIVAILTILGAYFLFQPLYIALTDVPYTFPTTPNGKFISQPQEKIDENGIISIDWSVPASYVYHNIEYRAVGSDMISGFSEETAHTSDEVTSVSIPVNSNNTFRHMSKGIYEYQVGSYDPESGKSIVSELLTIEIE